MQAATIYDFYLESCEVVFLVEGTTLKSLMIGNSGNFVEAFNEVKNFVESDVNELVVEDGAVWAMDC